MSKKNLYVKLPVARTNVFNFFKAPTNWFLISLLIIITAITFYPSLLGYYVNLDDPTYLVHNKSIEIFSNGWNWDAIKAFFISDYIDNYIPLTMVSYAIERCFVAQDMQSSAFIFHLDNLLLHLASVICVFFLFKKLGTSVWGAFLGALLFGIHPMRVESVAWITERKDVLYGFFFLLALLAYVSYLNANSGKWKWYLLTLFFTLLSLFSKVQAVTLPLSMVCIDFLLHKKWSSFRLLILTKFPLWILSILFGFINIYILKTGNVIGYIDKFKAYSLLDRFVIGMHTYIVYVIKFVYPYELVHHYEYPDKITFSYYFFVIVFFSFFVLAIRVFRTHKSFIFGLSFYTLNIMFVLQILSAGDTYQSDRYTYIAYLGLIFIFVYVYDWLAFIFNKNKLIIKLFLYTYILLLSFISFQQNKVWHNTVSLWGQFIKANNDSYLGYYNIGAYFLDLLISKVSDPDFDSTDPKLATYALQNFDMAILMDSLAGKHQPLITFDINIDRGIAFGYNNQYDSAIYCYNQSLRLLPLSKKAYSLRAWTYATVKNFDLAINDYKYIFSIDSTDPNMYLYCSLCESNLGQVQQGLAHINRALSLSPDNPQYLAVKDKLQRQSENNYTTATNK